MTADRLYRLNSNRFPLIQSVISGRQPGNVWIGDGAELAGALVTTKAGFACAFGPGASEHSAFNTKLEHALRTGTLSVPRYVLWYDPPQYWQDRLSQLLGDNRKIRLRVRLLWQHARVDEAALDAPSAPSYRVAPIDRKLLSIAEKLGLVHASRHFDSPEELLSRSFGVAIVAEDGEPLCLCYAVAIADGLAEVDIFTAEKARGKGLATLAVRRFCAECARRDLIPAWDCFEANAGSLRLAQTTGFTELFRYPFLTFNTPIA